MCNCHQWYYLKITGTRLHMAVLSENEQELKGLIQMGANVNEKDEVNVSR